MKNIVNSLICIFLLFSLQEALAQCSPPVPSGGTRTYSNCGITSFTLNVGVSYPSNCTNFPSVSGITFRWYNALTGGTLIATTTVPSGPAGNPSAGIYYSSYVTPVLSNSIDYYVCSVVGGVESSSRQLHSITIGTTVPGQPGAITATPLPVCTGISGYNYTVPNVAGVSYLWSYTGFGATIVGASNSITVNYSAAATSGNLQVYAVAGACTSAVRSSVITVNPSPALPPSVTANPYVFAPATFSLSASGSPAGTNYEWYNASTGGALLGVGATYSINSLSASTSYYVGTATTTCKSLTRKQVQVNVYPAPAVLAVGSPILFNNSCPVNLTVSSAYNRYEWTDSKGNIIGTAKDITVNKADDYKVKVFVGSPEVSATSTVFTVYNQFNTSSLPLNYVVSRTLKKAGVKTVCDISPLSVSDVQTSIEYIDGIGRSIQQVHLQASPSLKDIVQPIEYDDNGRVTTEYLSYGASTGNGAFKTGYVLDQAAFYNNSANNNADKIVNDAYPFAKKEYEASPLDVIAKRYAPGASWQSGAGRSVNINRRPNDANEVRNWVYDHATGNVSGASFYAAGLLWVEEITNEEGNQSIVYRDLSSRLIMSRPKSGSNIADTYYVYDDFGKVRYVISPAYTLTSITAGSPEANAYLFSYKYDTRMRLIEKKVPGAGVVYYVYNNQDLPVLSQDGNQRLVNKWTYFKYDVHKRLVMTGIYTHTSTISQVSMQALVDAQSNVSEKKSTGTTHGYTNVAFPTTNCEVLTVKYYDSYDFDNNGSNDYSYVTQVMINEVSPSLMVHSLPVGSKNKVLGSINDWLKDVSFYDKNKRVVQMLKNNQMNLGVMSDVETSILGFVGNVLETRQVHNPGTGNVTLAKRLEYDHMLRPKKVWHKVNTNAEVLLSQKNYNELGEVVEKNLHSENLGTTFLQSVDYTYNIKGQLTQINNIDVVQGVTGTNTGTNNDDNNDLFAYKLEFENIASLGNQPRYDGNISAITWRMGASAYSTSKLRAYRYTYDYMGRLTDASYGEFVSPSWQFANSYKENLSYDKNGNITLLKRYNSIGTLIDDLSYTYSGNALTKVKDLGSASTGFIDGVDVNNEYLYDNNGNLTMDQNKNILNITYNHLNLTTGVRNGDTSTEYKYDASGKKLTKIFYPSAEDGIAGATTQYIASYAIYNIAGMGCSNNCVTYLLAHEEGRVKPDGTTGYKYEYDLKDHLGNVHVTFDKNPSTGLARIIQEDHYYPFGMKLDGLSYDFSSGNKFLLNGKELQPEIGNVYDYGARDYDPAIGRWLSIDPLSEKYSAVGSYIFCLDNPIKYNDPDGRWIPGADDDNNILVTKEKGDNMKSLRKFMGDGYSRKEIRKMWKSMDKSTGSINLTKQIGGVFQEMTTSMKEAEIRGLPSTAGFIAGKERSKGMNYNCWGTCIALNDGKKLEGNGPGTGVGISSGSTFDAELKKNYDPVSRDKATVGETVLRYADRNTNSIEKGHGAVFMGVDNSGNEYSFSKNGWHVAPALFSKNYVDSIYGTPAIGGDNEVKGINPEESGYYQKK